MEMKLLSKYRSALMGIAMLLVAIFHCSIKLETIPVLNFVKFAGDMGVDIFFFVSGFGMYYSFLKDISTKEFYKKRILRIIPVWVTLNLVNQIYGCIIHGFVFKTFFLNLTGLSFFLTGSLYYWYVPAILLFYLVTPAFMKAFKKNIKTAYIGCTIVWILLLGAAFVLHNAHFFIMLFRVPIYFVGIYIGKMSHENVWLSKSTLSLTKVVFVVSLLPELVIMMFNERYSFIRYDFKYLCFFVTAIAGCILLCKLFDCSDDFYKTVVGRVLAFIGACTLEIYLSHEFLLARATYFLGLAGVNTQNNLILVVINIVVFVVTVLLANLIHKAFSKR